MDKYYSRSENSKGEKEEIATHLRRAGELCSKFLLPIGYEDWGYELGVLHDFGKISQSFQLVLKGEKTHVNHALPGALLGKKYNRNLAQVIASHHDGLLNPAAYLETLNRMAKGTGERLDFKGREISLFGTEELSRAVREWSRYFKLRAIKKGPSFSAEYEMLSRMLFVRFLFSALVDADWSSSAEHENRNYLAEHSGPPLDARRAMERLLEIRREKQRKSTAASALNTLRNKLFDTCLEAGKQAPGLFSLTAPTGLGKTLSLMAFALQHCISHNKRRILLLLPYLSIIEQNSRDYRQIIPELLEIHSHVDWTEAGRAESERWDAPCIVTTNVSFFEPLFGAKPAACRHLHQIANSVIVLDEAQTLPSHLLKATLRTVKELCLHYGCTVVFSTATQPSFQFLSQLDWQPRKIVPKPEALFDDTRRTRWEWNVAEKSSMCDIAQELAQEEQCAVIVNLKRHARALLQELQMRCDPGSLFYLTTELCPAHRTAVLAQVHSRLKEGLPCRLVATQCVEAGVDLDFPVVYRALAPLDSLIQAAGRCNRNGDSPKGRVKIFVPEDEGYPTQEYRNAAMCVKTLLTRHPIDTSNLDHIKEYYQLLYQNAGGDKPALEEAIAMEDYPKVEQEYRMIDQGGLQVLVPYSEKQALFYKIRDCYDAQGLTADLLAMARDITVSTFDRENVQRYATPLYYRKQAQGAPSVYLLGNPAFYDEKQGLHFTEPFDGIF